MKRSKFKKVGLGVAAAVAAAVSQTASAVSVVGADVTTQAADTQADLVTVGGLIIGLAVVAMGIRWVKATFF